MESELQPSVQEVLQAEVEVPLTTVPVRVLKIDNPVRTQKLPTKSAPTITKAVTVTPVRILPSDPFRSQLILMSDQDFYIAFNNASKETPGTMGRWPANREFTCDVDSEVWVAAVTTTANVSAFSLRWATGEN